jgi:type II secretion system protein G
MSLISLNRKRGFTLIELLVVIAIIGILASIVLASLDSSRKKGRDARRLSDIKQIQLALELYFDQNNAFPPAICNSSASFCGVTCGSNCASYLTGPGYISVVPTDPSNNKDYDYVAYYAVGGATNSCVSYHLGTSLESGSTHVALQNDRDLSTQSGSAGQSFGPCTATYSAASDFNGADTGKCNNIHDFGTACYDVIP